MAATLMTALTEAEQTAEQIRGDASKRAREIIKAAEQNAAAIERRETVKTRELVAQRLVEEMKKAEQEIAALAEKREQARQSTLRVASARAERAGLVIFERVTAHGNR